MIDEYQNFSGQKSEFCRKNSIFTAENKYMLYANDTNQQKHNDYD